MLYTNNSFTILQNNLRLTFTLLIDVIPYDYTMYMPILFQKSF
jgi:hypothetical protein